MPTAQDSGARNGAADGDCWTNAASESLARVLADDREGRSRKSNPSWSDVDAERSRLLRHATGPAVGAGRQC